jgi:hypothetical protein
VLTSLVLSLLLMQTPADHRAAGRGLYSCENVTPYNGTGIVPDCNAIMDAIDLGIEAYSSKFPKDLPKPTTYQFPLFSLLLYRPEQIWAHYFPYPTYRPACINDPRGFALVQLINNQSACTTWFGNTILYAYEAMVANGVTKLLGFLFKHPDWQYFCTYYPGDPFVSMDYLCRPPYPDFREMIRR